MSLFQLHPIRHHAHRASALAAALALRWLSAVSRAEGLYQLTAPQMAPLLSFELAYGCAAVCAVWAAAAFGVTIKLLNRLRHPVVSTLLYVAMGWVVVFAMGPLVERMPAGGLALLVAAGLTNEQAFRSATLNGGDAIRRFVDHTACVGVVAAGCEADLVIVRGNPLEDIGWICAKCWCFRHEHHIVGGVADLNDFIPAYEAESGRKVRENDLRYWQVMAHIRWAIIALQQAQRHLSGVEPSLELALTGKIVAELEWDVLMLTDKL